jgi:hypothetical protein
LFILVSFTALTSSVHRSALGDKETRTTMVTDLKDLFREEAAQCGRLA